MCEKKNKIAGIIVLYNPNVEETVENINSYIDEIDVLYCMDNSDKENRLFFSINKCIYIPYSENKGLSFALADGCKRAVEDGATILATFDQDTFFENGCIENLANHIASNSDIRVASPNVKRIIRYKENCVRRTINNPLYSLNIEEPDYVITSGCVFGKETYQKVGGFDQKLFIGQIDQDFCCSVRSHGGKVIRIGNVFMHQEMGNGVAHNFFGRKVYAPNLSPMRYYYIFRNERYLRKKWSKKYSRCKVELYKYIAAILLYENNKIGKLKNILKGFKDGKILFNSKTR